MSGSRIFPRLKLAVRAVQPSRVFVVLALSLLAGLLSDWLREDRVVFSAPLPTFTIIPASR